LISENIYPTAKILFLGLLCLAALLAGRPAFSEYPPLDNPKIDSDSNEKAISESINFLQETIRKEYQRPSPDRALIADYYQRIFALTPKTQQGKMAVWESYFTRRRSGDYSSALGTLQLIYGAFRHDETMIHPLAPDTPVNLHATADIEQADLFSLMSKSPLVAMNQMRAIPLRHKGVYVGIADGRRTYFGHVDVVVNLKMAKFHTQALQYNTAISLFQDIIRKHPNESYGQPGGLCDIEWIVMRHLHKALLIMNIGITKKILEIHELSALCKRDPAKAEARFINADLHEERIKKLHSTEDFIQAMGHYRHVVLNYNEIVFPTARGLEAMGPRAIVRLAELLTVLTHNNERAVLLLEELEKTIDRSTKGANETAAYARLHRAAIFQQKMNNPQQAVYLLSNFGKQFPQAVVYPLDKKKPRMLFEVANELMREAQSGFSSKTTKEKNK
jgi:Tetratricopeptide repeat